MSDPIVGKQSSAMFEPHLILPAGLLHVSDSTASLASAHCVHCNKQNDTWWPRHCRSPGSYLKVSSMSSLGR